MKHEEGRRAGTGDDSPLATDSATNRDTAMVGAGKEGGDRAGKHLIVIDEVGKMELLSQAFVQRVGELFDSSGLVLLATIPMCRPRQEQ